MPTLRGATPYLLFLFAIAAPGLLLFGYHVAELNAPQAVITCKSQHLSRWGRKPAPVQNLFGLPQCLPMNAAQFGFVSSIFNIGGLFGAFIGGSISARYGRLKGMLCAAGFYIFGPLLETFSIGLAVFSAGRLFSGFGAGIAMVTVPIFIAETAPPEHKGFFGSLTQVMTNVGILSTQVLGYFLSKGSLWRAILAAGGAIGLVQFIVLLLYGQESPQWLAKQGETIRAREMLHKIRGANVNIDNEIKHWEIGIADDEIGAEQETLLRRASHGSGQRSSQDGSNKGLIAVLLDQDSRFAVIVVIMVMLSQQFLGINSIIMYGVDLLSGLLSTNSAILNIGVVLLNLTVTILAAPLPDKWGRRPCLLTSMAGMGTSSLALAFAMYHRIASLSVVAVLTFVASFALGLGPVPFILSAELAYPDAVASTQSWGLAANYFANYIVAQFFPILNERLGGGKVYLIFAASAVFFGLFVVWALPESKGGRDVDDIWAKKKPSARED